MPTARRCISLLLMLIQFFTSTWKTRQQFSTTVSTTRLRCSTFTYANMYGIELKDMSICMHICITLELFRNRLSQLLLHFVSNAEREACFTVLFLCEQSSVVMICFTQDAVSCCKSCISTPETHRVSINSVSTKHFVYTTTPLKGQTRPSLVSIKLVHFPYSHACTLLQS